MQRLLSTRALRDLRKSRWSSIFRQQMRKTWAKIPGWSCPALTRNTQQQVQMKTLRTAKHILVWLFERKLIWRMPFYLSAFYRFPPRKYKVRGRKTPPAGSCRSCARCGEEGVLRESIDVANGPREPHRALLKRSAKQTQSALRGSCPQRALHVKTLCAPPKAEGRNCCCSQHLPPNKSTRYDVRIRCRTFAVRV